MLSKYFPFKPVFNITGNTEFKYCVGDACDMMRTFSSWLNLSTKYRTAHEINLITTLPWIFIFCLVHFGCSLFFIVCLRYFFSFLPCFIFAWFSNHFAHRNGSTNSLLTFANGFKTRREIIAIDYLLFIHKMNKYAFHFPGRPLRLNIFCFGCSAV